MQNEKSLIERLKIVLGLVEETEEETPETVEEVTPETVEEVIEETPETTEEVTEEVTEEAVEETPETTEENTTPSITEDEKAQIVSELTQIFETRIATLEEAMLLMGKNYKKENEELKIQVQKLSEQPGGVPVKPTLQIPQADNALAGVVARKQNRNKK
jgi:hypothetical protein